jgi:steroid 5-alpha reductase family enzyme
MSTVVLLLLAAAGLAALFAATWVFARRIDNYSIVDVAWSYAFAPLAVFYALAGAGWAPRRLALAVLVSAWSLRLGTHLYRRIRRHHPVEDGRYATLRERWQGQLDRRMAGFFQAQAASVVLLAIGFLPVVQNTTPAWHLLEWIGAALWLLAWSGEALADAQLATFARDPRHRGQVCEVGLWRYSRHPNYFFEWCTWVALAVIALASPWGWIGLSAPLIMLYLLLRVTGIPATEAQAVRSRGGAYRQYQQTTSAFVPWFRRSPSPSSP